MDQPQPNYLGDVFQGANSTMAAPTPVKRGQSRVVPNPGEATFAGLPNPQSFGALGDQAGGGVLKTAGTILAVPANAALTGATSGLVAVFMEDYTFSDGFKIGATGALVWGLLSLALKGARTK
jgi:hypothetical protein